MKIRSAYFRLKSKLKKVGGRVAKPCVVCKGYGGIDRMAVCLVNDEGVSSVVNVCIIDCMDKFIPENMKFRLPMMNSIGRVGRFIVRRARTSIKCACCSEEFEEGIYFADVKKDVIRQGIIPETTMYMCVDCFVRRCEDHLPGSTAPLKF